MVYITIVRRPGLPAAPRQEPLPLCCLPLSRIALLFMQYTPLGNTGLVVSRLSFGVMTVGQGAGTMAAVSKTDEQTAAEMIQRALDAGINCFAQANAGKFLDGRAPSRLWAISCQPASLAPVNFRAKYCIPLPSILVFRSSLIAAYFAMVETVAGRLPFVDFFRPGGLDRVGAGEFGFRRLREHPAGCAPA
ncbi:MAG: hypothetical protein ACM3PW_07720 [Chlamydiota bacterium]